MRNAFGFVLGLLFAVGLAISGMTQPAKVIGFLDFAGRWDPSLAFVMGGGIAVLVAIHRLVPRLRQPLLGGRFPAAASTDIDARLLVGSAIFGLGWGLAGFCPGPAVVGLGALVRNAIWFVPAMLAGIALVQRLEQRMIADETA